MTSRAILGFAALSTDVRVGIVKLLVRAGADGLPSGEIARKLDVPANSLSQQLAVLSMAGLVRQERVGRNVIYSVELATVRRLVKYLAVDCAAGRLEGVAIDG
jgi:DNA-binding transcriptional ArsR family regulator